MSFRHFLRRPPEGAAPGDVLKIETLQALPRVPYGVVSSRHGKGALPRTADGGAPDGITLEEVMPPISADGRPDPDPSRYGNVSTFTPVDDGHGVMSYGGDPHMAMGDGEVALTAMEGSLRGSYRLTVCKPGSGDAPSVAYSYPFAETADAWVPIGLSDPDGSVDAQVSDLDVVMRRAVVNALDFLEADQGMDRATAYAYLSAAADFSISQVVDRTVGVHGQIYKSHFAA